MRYQRTGKHLRSVLDKYGEKMQGSRKLIDHKIYINNTIRESPSFWVEEARITDTDYGSVVENRLVLSLLEIETGGFL
jgi:hypothetical protein